MLELLTPGTAMQFLEMRANNIDDLQLNPKDEERVMALISTKIRNGARIGAKAGALVGGMGAGVLATHIKLQSRELSKHCINVYTQCS